MRTILLTILALFIGHSLIAQCANNNTYYTDLTPSGVGQTATSNCTNGGNYNTFYACAGAQYTISTCGSAFNTVVTMYWHDSGNYIYYSNANNCLTNNETFTWTATATGVVRVLIDRNASCQTSALCAIMSITQNTVCPEVITASDCADAIDVCTNIDFFVDPNGFGAVNEIPPLGSFSNPDYGHSVYNPWGTLNEGCLRANELNSTWMIVNVETGGTLEFTFGGLGTQIGYYDWIMFEYNATTCSDIPNNNIAPIRCNWNGRNWGGTGICVTVPTGGHASNYEPALTVNDLDKFLIVFSNWSSVTTNVPLQFYGTATVSCTPLTPLPVELIRLSGRAVQNNTYLEWSTATETNNDYFKIERSQDNIDWVVVDIVAGQGNSNVINNYSILDNNPGNGIFYYRLSQFDYNGENEMLGIVPVEFELETWEIYPNPSTSQWQINSSQNLANCKLTLWEITGKEIPVDCVITDNSATLQLKEHRSGVYIVQIANERGTILHKTRLMAR